MKAIENQVVPALYHQSQLGEGPVWDPKTGSLFWVDILAGDIHEFKPNTGAFRTLKTGQLIGALSLCEDGTLLAALKNGIHLLDPLTGKLDLLTHPESHLPHNRYNDGKADPLGRFWVGTMV